MLELELELGLGLTRGMNARRTLQGIEYAAGGAPEKDLWPESD